jgi:FkbM family methyltransferase
LPLSRTDINRMIGNLFLSLGYEVRRKGQGFHTDAYADQRSLLSGDQVRAILDVGANVGQTAQRYRQIFPAATIHSFEPFGDTFRKLKEKCRGDGRIVTHQLAVADFSGSRTFYFNADSVTNSLLPNSATATRVVPDSLIKPAGSVDVPTTTLDDFCSERAIDHVSVLKMDIQGGELMALQGASRLLDAKAIDLIFSEVVFVEQYAGQADFHELCRFLSDCDYTLYGLYNLNPGRDSILAWADAIFIAPRIRHSLDRSVGAGSISR